MAILISPSPLGRISGRIGDVVFRNYSDKTVVSLRPRSFKPSMDMASVINRHKFKVTAALSKAVNDIPYANARWSVSAGSKMSAYNLILKSNYRSVLYKSISSNVKMFPALDFLAQVESVYDGLYSYSVNLDLVNSHLSGLSASHSVRLLYLVYCTSPVDSGDKEFDFISGNSSPLEINGSISMNFNLSFAPQSVVSSAVLDSMKSAAYTRYKDHTVFISFVILDTDGNPVKNSQTICIQNNFFQTK